MRNRTATIITTSILIAWLALPSATLAAGIDTGTKGEIRAAAGASFYIDPVSGSDSNTGGFDDPWETLDLSRIETRQPVSYPYSEGEPLQPANAGAPVQPGDTIYLRSGSYGTLDINGCYNESFVTLAAQSGHTPVFEQINLYGGCRWRFRGLTVRGTKPADYNYLVFLMSHGWQGPCTDTVMEGCHVYSAESIAAWTSDDWNNLANGGVQVSGNRIIVAGNIVENVDFGIVESGDGNRVEHNTIRNYCGDGIRLASNQDVVCQYNDILNNYSVNDNHNDGIQVYVGPGNNTPVYRYVLRGNRIIGHEDPDQPFADSLQGVGVFDNSMVDCLVENNVVMVGHWHGISLYGAVNTRVVNNTVFNPYHYGEAGYRDSWIAVVPAKDATPGRDCLVRNNISINIITDDHIDPVIDHNIAGDFDPDAVFADWRGSDARLREGSPAIDAGSPELAPETDIAGTVRPQGAGYDIGAYEYAPLISQYLAEGYTGDGFATWLCLGNPGEADALAYVTCLFPDGSSQMSEVPVPAASRATLNVNGVVGEGREVSFRIDCAQPVVVERPMYFSYGGAWTGGHDAVATPAPRQAWYFAEGYTGPGFDEWVCVLNPGDETAHLTFRFQTLEDGEVVREGCEVAARSRATFKVNDLLGPDRESSLVLEATGPVVAERPMYFDYQGTAGWGWTGGHCVMGSSSLSTRYFFAEGTTRSGFEEWLTLQNPSASPIEVHAVYQLGEGQGEPVEKNYTVGANQRFTVFVPGETGLEKDVSVTLTCDSPFLAERPMYFAYNGAWTGGHCVIGASGPASEWFFAEGYTGPGFDEWLCLQNPGEEEATVEITYLTQEAGPLPVRQVKVPAHTRLTLRVNDDAGLGYQLSALARVASGPGIVVERPMYFLYEGAWDGGHDVVGFTP